MTNAVAAAIHAANTAKRIASAPPASHLSRPDTPGRAGRRKGVHEVTESLKIAEATGKEIAEASALYRPVSLRAAILYFVAPYLGL